MALVFPIAISPDFSLKFPLSCTVYMSWLKGDLLVLSQILSLNEKVLMKSLRYAAKALNRSAGVLLLSADVFICHSLIILITSIPPNVR
jgi:hypothetical protein